MLQLKLFNSHNCILCGCGLNTGSRCCSSCELANVNQLITVKMSKDLRKLQAEPELVAGLMRLRQRILDNPDSVNTIRRQFAMKNTMGYGINSLLDFETPLEIYPLLP